MHDIIIIGGGTAGLTAAVYALRAGRSVLVLEKNSFGGQIAYSPKVENWPGTAAISGLEFADALTGQALALGAELELEEAVGIENADGFKNVRTADGGVFHGRAVIIAAGVKHRMLGVQGETELVGNGISFCAVCDGAFFAGQDVTVIGGGNSALQEALLLAETSRSVTIVQNLPDFTGEKKLTERLMAKPNVSAVFGMVVDSFETGEDGLSAVVIRPDAGGETRRIPCSGAFIAVGLEPENAPFADVAETDRFGYFSAGESCLTGTPGVFVAGDCRSKTARQLTTAAADGAVAALAAVRCLEDM